ncbi:hypothetical protein Tco_1342022 [Tanacetum coccineum]
MMEWWCGGCDGGVDRVVTRMAVAWWGRECGGVDDGSVVAVMVVVDLIERWRWRRYDGGGRTRVAGSLAGSGERRRIV